MGFLMTLLREFGPYGWFTVGALFLIAEVVVPGVNLIWFGAAATVTGLILFTTALSWEWQMVAFLGIAAASVLAARIVGGRAAGRDGEIVNRGATPMIGRELALAEPIVNGTGRALFGDGTWRVTGPDQPAGTRVRVVAISATTLVVEPAVSQAAVAEPVRAQAAH